MELGKLGVEGDEEFLHRFDGFVAHVRDAEGGAFDFSVAAVDEEAVVVADGFDPTGEVEVVGGLEATEALGLEAFGGEIFEAVSGGPLLEEGVGFFVALVAIAQAFREHVVDALFEGVDVWDGWSGRGVVLFVVLLELYEVEVVAAVGGGLGAGHGAFAGDEEGKSGGEGECFLDSAKKNVDSELVERGGHGGEGGDGVGDEEDVVELAHDGGDFFEGIEDAGGGLVVNEGDGVEAAFGELGAHGFGVDGLAPLDLDFLGFFAAALGDAIPFIGEGTAAEVKNFLLGEVAKSAFHNSPSRGGVEEDAS